MPHKKAPKQSESQLQEIQALQEEQQRLVAERERAVQQQRASQQAPIIEHSYPQQKQIQSSALDPQSTGVYQPRAPQPTFNPEPSGSHHPIHSTPAAGVFFEDQAAIQRAERATQEAFDQTLSQFAGATIVDSTGSNSNQLQPERQTMANKPNQEVAAYFADKIESNIQRLKGSNWATWKWQLFNVLDAKGLTTVLESEEPRGSPREIAARQIISSSLDSSIVSKVVHCSSAQQIWSCLRGIYENRTSFALTDLIGRMNSYRMSSLNDVENGISEIQAMASQIKALNGSVDDAAIESAILRGLPGQFQGFITSWTFLDSEKRTLDNLHAHLMRTQSRRFYTRQNQGISRLS